MPTKTKRLPAIHPGEILREDFMKPLKLSSNKLAIDLRVPVTRISEIVNERRGITADTALRLGHYFDMNAQFWLNLQMMYELDTAKREGKVERIERDIHRHRAHHQNGSRRQNAT